MEWRRVGYRLMRPSKTEESDALMASPAAARAMAAALEAAMSAAVCSIPCRIGLVVAAAAAAVVAALALAESSRARAVALRRARLSVRAACCVARRWLLPLCVFRHPLQAALARAGPHRMRASVLSHTAFSDLWLASLF